MPKLSNFETGHPTREEFSHHSVVFKTRGDDDFHREVCSSSPVPLPRAGEYLYLTESGITGISDGGATGEYDETPPDADEVFCVEEIVHEYAFVTASDEAQDQYVTGYGIETMILLTKTTPAFLTEDEEE